MENTPPTPQLQPGQLLSGRYRIDSLLARGSMGEVYIAYDQELERQIAIKTLPLTQSDSEQLKERFQLQARAAARIGHPGIVETYDRGTEGDLPFVVMERLEGQNLRDRIRECHPLDMGFIVRVGIELTRAVRAAHKKGVIHRDLKPSNVFLAVSGDQSDVVKVLDFGVAKVFNAKVLTQTGQVIGTPTYMAPEQLQNSKQVDGRADIYSIGCILYEMLTGRPPFEAASGIELVMKVKNDRPEPVARLRNDVPAPLIAVVERAMSKDHRQRFPNAALLADALCDIASKAGVSIPPQYESLRPLSGNPPAAQETDLAVAPTVLSSPLSTSYEANSTVQLESAEATTRLRLNSKQRFVALLMVIGVILVAAVIAVLYAL
jgi:serine/threonine protein kinase